MNNQLKISVSNRFKKDIEKLKKQDKDLSKLKFIIDILTTKQTLDKKYLDHSLRGEFKGYKECHIEPDWLLIYFIDDDILNLARTGSQSELFK